MFLMKWLFVVLGMGTLTGGLNVQAAGMIDHQDMIGCASVFYTIGALLLIIPPMIEKRTASTNEDREFAKLLVTLEIFLTISGLMYFLKAPELKIPIRVMLSLSVTAFLKYRLEQLPQFQWSVLYNPVEFFKYHRDAFTGRLGPAYSMSLGIDWLGIGYAFLDYTFGKFALEVGSLYLFISAYRGWRATRQPLSFAWTGLNGVYVLYGLLFWYLA